MLRDFARPRSVKCGRNADYLLFRRRCRADLILSASSQLRPRGWRGRCCVDCLAVQLNRAHEAAVLALHQVVPLTLLAKSGDRTRLPEVVGRLKLMIRVPRKTESVRVVD